MNIVWVEMYNLQYFKIYLSPQICIFNFSIQVHNIHSIFPISSKEESMLTNAELFANMEPNTVQLFF
jgi:hypothetical protein